MEEPARIPKPSNWDWILWWRINPAELNRQVVDYATLKPYQSMRGISALCLCFSALVTIVFILVGADGLDKWSYFDVGLMTILAAFVYFGHRWAMIGAMILWTLEKILGIVPVFFNPLVAGSLFTQVLWWVIYMHAFYFAFRVEQARRRGVIDTAVFE